MMVKIKVMMMVVIMIAVTKMMMVMMMMMMMMAEGIQKRIVFSSFLCLPQLSDTLFSSLNYIGKYNTL